MLGKILFKNVWHLCRYENNNLDIFHNECDAPLRLIGNSIKCLDEAVIAHFEDGYFYFFDLSGNADKMRDEYFICRYLAPNFFKTFEYSLKDDYNLQTIDSVSFKNGVLMPMITLSDIPKFEVCINQLPIAIEFSINKAEDNFLCNMRYGKMLSNYPNIQNEYCLFAKFSHPIDISTLNSIIDSLYKVVQFINIDFAAPIGSINVATNVGELLYFKNGINLTNQPIKRFNFVNNCKDSIVNLVDALINDKYDLNFLRLLDKEEFTDNDFWVVAQSLEKNIIIK